MKKLVVPVILLLLMLVGCAKTDSMLKGKNLITATCDINEITDTPIPVTDKDAPFYATESRVFRSYDELQEYIGRIEECENTEEILSKLKSYDKSFFEANILFYGYETGCGNISHEYMGTALTDGSDGKPGVEIYVKTDPGKCIESSASYCFYVTLARSDVETVDDSSFLIVTCLPQ